MSGTSRILAGCLLAFCASALVAEEELPGFVTDLNAGLNLNRGNTENSSLNLGAQTRFRSEVQEFDGRVLYNYGETTRRDEGGGRSSETTTDNAEANLQYNFFLTEQTYALAALSAFKDEQAAVNHRILIGPGLGTYLVRNEVWQLSVEGGLSYLMEDIAGESGEELVYRLAQNYDRALSENARVWQKLEYLPEVEDASAYLLNAEIGAEAKLNGNLSLRTVLVNRYDSEPAADSKKNDLSLLAGVSLRL
jgi:putative salt-induced outer membrane protein YdiY